MDAAVVAEGEQQVPGGSEVPGKFQSDRISRRTISGASDIDLGRKETVAQMITEQQALTPAISPGAHLIPGKCLTEICNSGRSVFAQGTLYMTFKLHLLHKEPKNVL